MIAQKLKEAGKGIVSELRQSFAAKGVNASGTLSRELRSVVEENSAGARMYVDALGYVFEVEEGTPPKNLRGYKNKPPAFLVERIRKWIDDKQLPLFSGFRNKDGMAWAITTKINREGTTRHRNKIRSGAISDVINDGLISKIEGMLADAVEIDTLEAITKTTRTK